MDLKLLEAKLKRLKIHSKITSSRIEIGGKAKFGTPQVLISLGSLGVLLFVIVLAYPLLIEGEGWSYVITATILLGLVFFSQLKMLEIKNKNAKKILVLENNQLIIKDDNSSLILDKNNSSKVFTHIEPFLNKTEGTLLDYSLRNDEKGKNTTSIGHLKIKFDDSQEIELLSFVGDNEKYVEDDLKYLKNVFNSYLNHDS